MPKSLDVVAIGNAIVDVIARVDDGFVAANGVERGAMTLIDAERGEALYAAMPPGIAVSGGSAGNTAAGLAALGPRAGHIGTVRDDALGTVFRPDLPAQRVRLVTGPSPACAARAAVLGRMAGGRRGEEV